MRHRLHAGDRCAPDLVVDLKPGFYASRPGFKLVLFEGLPGYTVAPLKFDEIEAIAREMCAESAGLITDFHVVPAVAEGNHQRFGAIGQCLFLIRPDGYVAFRCEPISKSHVLGYLRARVHATNVREKTTFMPVVFDWIHGIFWAVVAIGVAQLVRNTVRRRLGQK